MVETKEKVTRIEDLLAAKSANDKKDKENSTESTVNASKTNKENVKKAKIEIPKGKPKSGRVWKEQKQRFSSIIKSRGTRLSLEKKQKLREELKKAKELSKEKKAEMIAEKEAKKERRKENLRRAEVNRKKSEVVQVIKNTAKIKRMKKKQLRKIEKRDTVNA